MKATLEQAGVADLIETATSSDDAERSKPDPDIVHAALERSRRPASHAVMLGDTPYDIEAATRAGVRIVALRCGGYWSDKALAGAESIYDDPAALLARYDDSLGGARARRKRDLPPGAAQPGSTPPPPTPAPVTGE